jgi:thermitase
MKIKLGEIMYKKVKRCTALILVVILSLMNMGVEAYATSLTRITIRSRDPSDIINNPSNIAVSHVYSPFASSDLKEYGSQAFRQGFLEPNPSGKNANLDEVEGISSAASFAIETSELVIGLKNGLSGASNLACVIARFGGKMVNEVMMKDEPLAVVVNSPSNSISLLERAAWASGVVRYVEFNEKFQAQLIPNDPYYVNQWAPSIIKADWAWNTTTGSQSVLVAVIDTGIDYNHPDLAANYNASGYNWVSNDANVTDDNGHGTICAGIIAGVLNNHVGIAGLAQVQIMAEKGLDSSGAGYEDELASAIIHAVDHGAKILSLSWGSDQDSQLIHEAIQYAYAQDVLVVAAAGNNASTTMMYPAAYKEVIAVTATDQYDDPASFSSYGDWVELAAPGVHIYSTLPTYHVVLNDPPYSRNQTYDYLSGTSVACPQVTGVGALVWSRFPNATRDWVRAQLRNTADDLGEPGFDQYYGYGRINAKNAVEQSPPTHDLQIFDWEKPRSIQPGDIVVFSLTVLNFGTSDEQNVTAELFIDSSLQDSSQIADLPAGSSWTTGLSWNPLVEGMFNVTLYVVPVVGETITANNVVTEIVLVQKMLTLNPFEGPAGTKVVATGITFSPLSQVMITFNDALVGFIVTDASGSFEFTFNVPFSSAGVQVVKASDSAGNTASSIFEVVDTTSLVVQVDVGTTHFIGETANFYAQTTFKGQSVDANVTKAMLYKPNGVIENLTAQAISTGLNKITYTLVGNQTGTYTLVVEASYITDTIQANGTSFKCFLVSDTLTLLNQQVLDIEGGIARVQTDLGLIGLNLTAINGQVMSINDGIANVKTDLGFVNLNLTAINATLESVFLYVKAINGTTATIQTTIGTMNGTITSMNDNVASILVPGVGEIKTDVSTLMKTREAWTIPQYAILLTAVIAAVGAILSGLLLLGQRKRSEPKVSP